MAYLFKRNRSPFWWIGHRDATGKNVQETTKFKVGVGADTRRAELLRAQWTLKEAELAGVSKREAWDLWVEDFFNLHYASAANTRYRASTAWRSVKQFLTEKKVLIPRQLTRGHCMEYIPWRLVPDKAAGKYKAVHNTALLELKFLGLVMKEAVKREFAAFNPCRELGIKRMDVKEKPELQPEIVQRIRAGFADEPEPRQTFLRNSFEIAFHHGVRLNETNVNPMQDVDLWEEGETTVGQISFVMKGKRIHTVMIHRNLIPLFRKLRAEKKTQTYEKPNNPSKEWWHYLRRIGVKQGALANISFHCTRVTVASALERGGIEEKKAMGFMNHASTTVHRIYIRRRAQDFEDCTRVIQ